MFTQIHVAQLVTGRKAMLNFLVACTVLMLSWFSAGVGVHAQEAPEKEPDQLNTVYVDLSNTTCAEDGSSTNPFNTISEGITAVSNNGEVLIHPGDYGDKLTVTRPMTWHTTGGVVTIGQGNVGSAFCYKIYLPVVGFGR